MLKQCKTCDDNLPDLKICSFAFWACLCLEILVFLDRCEKWYIAGAIFCYSSYSLLFQDTIRHVPCIPCLSFCVRGPASVQVCHSGIAISYKGASRRMKSWPKSLDPTLPSHGRPSQTPVGVWAFRHSPSSYPLQYHSSVWFFCVSFWLLV